MSDKKDEYFKVRVESINPDKIPSFDIFLFLNNHYVLYRRAGTKVEKEKIEALKKRPDDVFLVPENQRQLFKDYISEQINSDILNPQEKAKILRESSYSLVEELFENPNLHKAMDESKIMVNQYLDFMKSEPKAMANLIGLSCHDFYTYNHSLDVCIYSLGLGFVAGYKDDYSLRELGRGSLFHDIGKRHVAAEIITKKGSLDDIEWSQMKQHPLYGLKIINDYPDGTDELKACAFEHHENHTGNGYPQGLNGDDIHPMARIVALTDCYDALTTKRSYNEPMHPKEALDLMKNKIGSRFDPDLLGLLYSYLLKLEKERG